MFYAELAFLSCCKLLPLFFEPPSLRLPPFIRRGDQGGFITRRLTVPLICVLQMPGDISWEGIRYVSILQHLLLLSLSLPYEYSLALPVAEVVGYIIFYRPFIEHPNLRLPPFNKARINDTRASV